MTSIITGAAQTAHAAATSLLEKAQAKAGDKLPLDITVKETAPDAPVKLELTGKNVIVAVPGAFTPSCSSQAPGYIEKYQQFKDKGVNEVFILTVNDVFVVKAWKKNLAPEDTPVRFLADDQGSFASALGLVMDATAHLGAPRAKRFVLITEGDTIETVIVEENSSQVTTTDSAHVLSLL
ncbi:Redoxin [Amylostereum chailletii]|nr:Redoxin [Amylostereum chailletii]